MNRADGATKTNRSGNVRRTPDAVEMRRADALAYDSDQVPVLIRLPDLSPRPVSSARDALAVAATTPVDSKTDDDDKPVPVRLEAERKPRIIEESRNAVRSGGLLAAIPSQALVLAMLLVITGVAYLLIQGVPRPDSGGDQRSGGESALPPVVDATAPTSAESAAPGTLWPRDSRQDDSGAISPEPDLISSEPTLAIPSVLAGSPHIETSGDGSSPRLSPALQASVPDETPVEGPSLDLQGTTPVSAPASSPEPIQGWPPGFGDSDGPSAAVPPAKAMRETRNAQLPPSVATGGSVESATLDGTIEFTQPRVDHERTRTGIY